MRIFVLSFFQSYFYYSAKNEMDMHELMFFLTGGVGLENKVGMSLSL